MQLRHVSKYRGMMWLIPFVVLGMPAAHAAEDKDGVEVLARGPVHEAFADPNEQQPTASPLVPKKAPNLIDEVPPDQKPEGDNIQWIPGYWHWEEERKDFIWISGFWRQPPPNKVWVAGSWQKIGDSYQWVSGFWQDANQQQPEIQYLPQPPAPIQTEPSTPAPNANSIYVPGAWTYQDRYVWRAGYWIDYQPDRIWIPSRYRWTPCGYVFCPGYWDYPLANRGLLFAPVFFQPRVFAAASFAFTPNYVVQEDCLYRALFVRRGFSHYCFGDYFGVQYANIGYTPWCGSFVNVGFNVGRGFRDPLFCHYHVGFRNDPFWNGGISDLYVGRYRGLIAPPPRTLVQQNVVINNITNNTVINNNTTVINNNITNVSMVNSLNNIRIAQKVPLQQVTLEQRQQQIRASNALREVALQRQQQEAQLLAKNPQPVKITDAPRAVKLDLPKPIVRAQSPDAITPPRPVTTTPQAFRDIGGNQTTKPKVDSVVPNTKPYQKMDPKVDGKLQTPVQPRTDVVRPTDIKPLDRPKFDPKGNPTTNPNLPKIEPKVNPAVTPNVPKVEPKVEPKGPTRPRFDPRGDTPVNPTQPVQPKVQPSVTTPPKVEPKVQPSVTVPPKSDTKPNMPVRPELPKVNPNPVNPPVQPVKPYTPPVTQPRSNPVTTPATNNVPPKINPQPTPTPRVNPTPTPVQPRINPTPTPPVQPRVNPSSFQPRGNPTPPPVQPRVNPTPVQPRINPTPTPPVQPRVNPAMVQPRVNPTPPVQPRVTTPPPVTRPVTPPPTARPQTPPPTARPQGFRDGKR